MAINGLGDIVSTVTLSKSEYEDLIRESNTLRIVENLVAEGRKQGCVHIELKLLGALIGLFIDEMEDIENGSK